MSIRVAIHHHTKYQYDRTVALSSHLVRLRPAVHCRTPIVSYSLKIQPENHFINWHQDPFGNFQARVDFLSKTNVLDFTVDLVADMTVINPFDFFLESYADEFPFHYEESLKKELSPYLEIKENGPHLTQWLSEVSCKTTRTVDFLVGVNQKLNQAIKYNIRMEPGVQTCEETLGSKSGSCRDSAWLLVQILRHLGLAARFSSGYIVQLTSDVKSLDGPSGPENDFTDLHAWTEVFIPGGGWIGLDPTSGLFAGEGHIPLSCTPNPSSAAPVTGSTEKCETTFEFSNTVTRIHEDPRVTKPFTEEQWAEINAFGADIDQKVQDDDIRLTLGGEPTFVSIDDMDDPQWNTTALGQDKWLKACVLFSRLHNRFAPGGLKHFGQGKWYPGEELPRWAYSCYWRKDGEPVWKDDRNCADPRNPLKHGINDAKRFVENLTERLNVSNKGISEAYEDVFYYLWKEGNLPDNVDPLKANLKDSMERKRIARLLEKGLEKVAGYVLPIMLDEKSPSKKWKTGKWTFRRGRLYLIPGDSAMGYRLPLEALPYEDEKEQLSMEERSPFAPRTTFPSHAMFQKKVEAESGSFSSKSKAPQELHIKKESDGEKVAHGVVRTALCVEPRNGTLHIFMPPVTDAEKYLELIALIEQTAKGLKLPVLIEGYAPPKDWRLVNFSITPDPGVIEVNLQPSANWEELVHNTTVLYEEARLSRLGTEKFMVDGRHSGTGGGNHVTLGGAKPEDSPFLRKPELLRSIVNFWQHHPSLSYLFSGLFIGPTSQMPRVDEARDENIYELEIAFQQIENQEGLSPWKVDRALRHLLVDLTGNTHRAEISIDKLYSPSGYSGRQGLVEMRGFEMPPHSRMSLAQMLLIKALVVRFWNEPYSQKLVRWGTELHDRFMLPHYVWADFKDVIRDLNTHGFPFKLEWFDSFFEFRFPHYGTLSIDDIQLEVRMAVEPWNVLGEETSSTGTSRYVDSSVERLQVKVLGMTHPRHVIACNSRFVPMHSTGTHGEYVAGVRYKAWQPPSGLHPSIPPHTPLVFDVLDAWEGRSIGGCMYYVSHPGGRHYDTFPINANEAESRRISRFWSHGHTPGFYSAPKTEFDPEHPHTLDLRKEPVGVKPSKKCVNEPVLY